MHKSGLIRADLHGRLAQQERRKPRRGFGYVLYAIEFVSRDGISRGIAHGNRSFVGVWKRDDSGSGRGRQPLPRKRLAARMSAGSDKKFPRRRAAGFKAITGYPIDLLAPTGEQPSPQSEAAPWHQRYAGHRRVRLAGPGSQPGSEVL